MLPPHVLDPPKLIKGITPTVRNQSDSVTFTCSFVGVPAPSIDWYKQDNPELNNGLAGKRETDDARDVLIVNSPGVSIVESTIQRMDNLEESQSALTISSLVRSSNEGLYTCRGRNDVENVIGTVMDASATLTVHGKPHQLVAYDTILMGLCGKY